LPAPESLPPPRASGAGGAPGAGPGPSHRASPMDDFVLDESLMILRDYTRLLAA
jgi:hypothetical protein